MTEIDSELELLDSIRNKLKELAESGNSDSDEYFSLTDEYRLLSNDLVTRSIMETEHGS
jgi:hypothetical protein